MLYNVCISNGYYVLLFTKYTYVILSFFPYSIYGSNLTPVNKQLYKKKKKQKYINYFLL